MSTLRIAVVLTLLLLGLSPGRPARSQLVAGTGDTRSATPRSLTGKVLSNPYCYQPDPAVDECIINIRYYSATDNGTTAPYMVGANISINGKLRLRQSLFFENSITYSYDMAPAGLKVPCGAPNSGGVGATYGQVYLVRAEPIDSDGANMGYDQANLYCPPFQP